MKIATISFLVCLQMVTVLQAKAPNGGRDSVAFAIKRSLYFKVDKAFRGATLEIFDSNGKMVQKEVLTKTATIIYFDNLVPGSYIIAVKKDGNEAVFLYNNIFCFSGYIHLKKNHQIIDLSFIIPDDLKDESEREAIVSVGKQIRESINLILAEDKQADIEVDVLTNHYFSLRTFSDIRTEENQMTYSSLVHAQKLIVNEQYVAGL